MENDEQSIDGRRERDYDISRLMAFSDGVFAVAITLLVFNVRVPAIAQNDALSRLPAALLQTAPPLLTFTLSFFLVGFYWIRHHQLFRQVVSADVWLLWLNLVVLFLVCLLPFSSGVVGRYHNTVIGAKVYAFNLAAIAIAFSALLYMYASRAQQVRPLPPGMGTGYFSQGLLLPIVVVAMVMALAPLNLVAAYVTGVALMAPVSIYTAAVPRTVSSAPLKGAAGGRLRFPRGATWVTVRAGTAMPELFWARFTGTKPNVRVVVNDVDIESRGFGPVTWRLRSAHIALNASIPWQFGCQGGAWRLTADLRGLQLTMVTLEGGASKVDLRLPRPSGTVPIRIRGGASEISVRRPNGVAVRVVVHGGFGKLQVDGKSIEAADEKPVQSPDYVEAADRYDLELAGGANQFVLATEPS